MCRSALGAVGVISFITISPSITTVSPQPKPVSEKYFAYLNPHNEASVYSYARLDSSRRQWRSNCPWRSFLNRRRQHYSCLNSSAFCLILSMCAAKVTRGWHGHGAQQNGVIMTWTRCHKAGQTLTYFKTLPKDMTVWLLLSRSGPHWLERCCGFIFSSLFFTTFCFFPHRKIF